MLGGLASPLLGAPAPSCQAPALEAGVTVPGLTTLENLRCDERLRPTLRLAHRGSTSREASDASRDQHQQPATRLPHRVPHPPGTTVPALPGKTFFSAPAQERNTLASDRLLRWAFGLPIGCL